MSIDETGWNEVERRALAFEKVIESHCPELANVETPKVPTFAEPLHSIVVHAAEMQVKMLRKDEAISSAIMYLSVNDTQRALECLNRALLGL